MIGRASRYLKRILARLRSSRIQPVAPPLAVTDGEGRDVHVRAYQPDDFEGLAAMYVAFDPAQRAQGTPPIGTEAVEAWLETILQGVNVVAYHDDAVVGHVSLVPDGTGRHELAIFVHQDYQRAGIGTELLAAGLGEAREQGITYVWLTVEAWKRGAQRLYSRAGFSTVNPMGAAHRMSRYL